MVSLQKNETRNEHWWLILLLYKCFSAFFLPKRNQTKVGLADTFKWLLRSEFKKLDTLQFFDEDLIFLADSNKFYVQSAVCISRVCTNIISCLLVNTTLYQRRRIICSVIVLLYHSNEQVLVLGILNGQVLEMMNLPVILKPE